MGLHTFIGQYQNNVYKECEAHYFYPNKILTKERYTRFHSQHIRRATIFPMMPASARGK